MKCVLHSHLVRMACQARFRPTGSGLVDGIPICAVRLGARSAAKDAH